MDTPYGLETLLRRSKKLWRRILAILRLARTRGIYETLRLVRVELQQAEPTLASIIRDGQLRAYFAAGKKTLLAMDSPPGEGRIPPTWGRFPTIADDPLPPVRFPVIDEAVKYLRTRIAYTPAEFATLAGDARNVGFTVARVQTAGAVDSIREALVKDVEDGGTLTQFRARIADAIEETGVADHHVETLYRTHVGRAYSMGQQRVLNDPMVHDEFPYLMYSATHDARTRPTHLALETMGLSGTAVYRADDPIWDTFLPPWDWNCRCATIPLSIEDAASYGVKEAKDWERSGRAPLNPQYVTLPSFRPSASFEPVRGRLTPLIAA